MRRHVSEARLLDVLEGVGKAEDRAHVASCARCRARVDRAREGLSLASDAEVPEPSPLYWEAFRRQVGRRIVAQDRLWRRRLTPLLAAAAALVAVASLLPWRSRAPERAVGAALPAWSALPPVEEDAGLTILEALAAEGLGSVEECRGGLAHCLADLSEEETLAAVRLLEREMEGREL